ncbi:MAG: hypothetical protein HDR10_03495 [Lachnospiraceae bacterium]|nr:hypothetical protein [Lachnospiraceae bacterium]
MKEKWSAGKIVGLILGIIAAVIVLWIAFIISVYQLAEFLVKIDIGNNEEYEEPYAPEEFYDNDYDHDSRADSDEEIFSYEDQEEFDTEYYDFRNAIRKDLDYQADFTYYEKDDFVPEDEPCIVYMYFDYPVISGDIPNVDGINQAIYKEIDEIEEYMTSVTELLSEGDVVDYIGTGYVTYMTDEFLSIIYVEYGFLNEEFLESYVVSLNFDVQTGMVLNNTDLLNINDDFSIDFRERCERQNGEIDEFYYMSDQEITSYLMSNDYLIIFYTPMGMEIGFNYYDGWVTVTYKDYERYQKHL